MYLQSIKSVEHNAAKSVNRSFLKKSRHIGFGVFIVHSSMASRVEKTPSQSRAEFGQGWSLEGPKFISVQLCVCACQLMKAEGAWGRDCNCVRNQPPLEIESTKMSWGAGILEQSMWARNRE